MGFRTLAMSADFNLELPAWFVEKYRASMHFGEYDGKASLPIVTKHERKFYGDKEEDLFLEFQRVIRCNPDRFRNGVEFVLLHECGGVTMVRIGVDFIRMYEPTEWHEVEGITHGYACGDDGHPCQRRK